MTLNKVTLTLSSILLFLSNTQISFADGISLSSGESKSRYFFKNRGKMSADNFRAVYSFDLPFFKDHAHWDVQLEAGVQYWRDPYMDDEYYGAVLTPMFRYHFHVGSVPLFAGAGIGISYLDSEQIMDRKLGSHLLFEDRFEFGIGNKYGHRISASLNHYSNANLADINHGVNVVYLTYAYHWQ